jgi:hypothetical protein
MCAAMPPLARDGVASHRLLLLVFGGWVAEAENLYAGRGGIRGLNLVRADCDKARGPC